MLGLLSQRSNIRLCLWTRTGQAVLAHSLPTLLSFLGEHLGVCSMKRVKKTADKSQTIRHDRATQHRTAQQVTVRRNQTRSPAIARWYEHSHGSHSGVRAPALPMTSRVGDAFPAGGLCHDPELSVGWPVTCSAQMLASVQSDTWFCFI